VTSSSREAKQKSFQSYLKRKKMKEWVAANGKPTQEQNEISRDAWLRDNEITVCPPFGHNDAQWGALTKGSRGCRKRSRGRG
jgi:hypothetical protein